MKRKVRIAGMMRVKNEERWIRRSVKSLFPLCEYVCILDDNSIDNTTDCIDSIEDSATHYYSSPFDGLDEQRDKNYLLGLTLREGFLLNDFAPDWIIHIDGDEVLGDSSAEKILQAIETVEPHIQAFTFKVDYLWDRPDQYRVDGRYDRFWRGSMFRTVDLERGFRSTRYGDGANFHCSNIPGGIKYAIPVPVRLKHYGYMDRVDRLAKWEYYNRIDPDNEVEDRYRHMILGDREDLPAEMKTKWAGPLELKEWVDGPVELPK